MSVSLHHYVMFYFSIESPCIWKDVGYLYIYVSKNKIQMICLGVGKDAYPSGWHIDSLLTNNYKTNVFTKEIFLLMDSKPLYYDQVKVWSRMFEIGSLSLPS